MRKFCLAGVLALGIPVLAGCSSAFVETDVRNAGRGTVRLIEVDYPSASFGVESLAAGKTYHYRFKVQGSGPTKITWTDEKDKEHSAAGPQLHEGQQGPLTISISGDSAHWESGIQP